MRGFPHPVLFVLALLLLQGCWGAPHAQRAAIAEENGALLLYLEPFQRDAERIGFVIGRVWAEREDGLRIPLDLRYGEIIGGRMTRQHLVATGRLRPGDYRGLQFEVTSASLRTEDGLSALLVSGGEARRTAPFRIEREKTLLLSLVFDPQESLEKGYRFSPVFQTLRPERPPAGLAGYVTNRGAGDLLVFDKKRMQVRTVLSLGKGSQGLILDPLEQRAYAAMTEDDSVAVVDTASGDVISVIRLLRGDRPRDLVLAGDGHTLVAINEGSHSASFLDTRSAIEVDRLPVGRGPAGIILDRKGVRAYVFSPLSNSISVIDVAARKLIAAISADSGPLQGEFNKKGDRLYVLYEGSPFMNVLDPFSFGIVKRVYVGMHARAVKVDTDTDMVYVARSRSAEVDVYDPFSLLPVDLIPVGSSTDFMVIDHESNVLFLLSSEQEKLTAVHLNSRSILSAIDLGKGPYRVRIAGER